MCHRFSRSDVNIRLDAGKQLEPPNYKCLATHPKGTSCGALHREVSGLISYTLGCWSAWSPFCGVLPNIYDLIEWNRQASVAVLLWGFRKKKRLKMWYIWDAKTASYFFCRDLRDLAKNNLPNSHPIFGPPSVIPIEKNPQRSLGCACDFYQSRWPNST